MILTLGLRNQSNDHQDHHAHVCLKVRSHQLKATLEVLCIYSKWSPCVFGGGGGCRLSLIISGGAY